MKRRTEFLVEKRDGRRVWLRASKLARSIFLALQSAEIDEPWRAMDLASSVLTGLRSKHGDDAVLTTDLLAEAVQRVLEATGFQVAAGAYDRVGAERRRRRVALSPVGPCSEGHTIAGSMGIVGRAPLEGPQRV